MENVRPNSVTLAIATLTLRQSNPPVCICEYEIFAPVRPGRRRPTHSIMGWCLTWFAVKDKDPETVRADLGLRFNGERVSSPIPRIAGAGLPGGRYLVQRLRYECRDAAVYARLSAGCEVVSLFVEEHVMVSSASGWKDGRRLWSVMHEDEQGATAPGNERRSSR